MEVAHGHRQSRLFIERRILVIDPIGDFAESIGNFSGSIGNFSSSIGNLQDPIGNFFDSIGNLQDPIGNFFGSIGNFFGSIGNFRNPLLATFPSIYYRPSSTNYKPSRLLIDRTISYRPSHLVIGHCTTLEIVFRAIAI